MGKRLVFEVLDDVGASRGLLSEDTIAFFYLLIYHTARRGRVSGVESMI